MEGISQTFDQQLPSQCEEIEGVAPTFETRARDSEGDDRTIREQLAKGIIKPVSLAEKTTKQVHHLPHHGVVHRD